MPFWGQLSLQDAASPLMYFLIKFHDHAMMTLSFVMTFVTYMLIMTMKASYTSRKIFEANELEAIWTIIPALILIFLAIPSLRLLYLMDESVDPKMTLKTIGHQWYWSYEYPDFNNLSFDSYMTQTEDLPLGHFRLLEVDRRATIPLKTEIRLIVTSDDVIHSWTIPAMGAKVDAIPGRINQQTLFFSRPGVYYGQCSEICGANHTFMPIALEALLPNSFIDWTLMNSAPFENLHSSPLNPS